MQIQTDKLKRRPRQIVIDERVSDFPVLQELIEQGSFSFAPEIKGTLEATWAGDIIAVTGSLETEFTAPCSRCLMPVAGQLNVAVTLSYTESNEEKAASVAEEIEIHADELGLIPFSEPEIDLRPDLEQEILMALPPQLMCKESCQGLCPVCGCNQNLESCHCTPPVFHAGLAVLGKYKVKK